MKKLIGLAFLLMLLFTASALAQEAPDLTLISDITVSAKAFTKERLHDRNWDTAFLGEDNSKTITIKSPQAIHGLYICFAEEPRAWVIEQKIDGAWQALSQPRSHVLHQYIPLNGAKELRIKPEGGSRKWFGVKELFLLGEGELPAYIQQWQQPDGKADLMVFFAHPDDESLFFGGTLPTYAGERGLDVVAATISYSTPTRRSELLNALWVMGVKNYPVFGPFHDKHSLKLTTAYKTFNEQKVKRYVVELFRQYKPEVVVTHDTKGEYGHGMHMMVADASLYAFDLAANESKYPDSLKASGAWQVKKLYLHLYPENQITMDWDQPLHAFSGRTGFEMAQEGYRQHQTQQRLDQFKVEPRDSQYSSYLFGLAKTTVGPDTLKNDFLENITTNTFLVEEEQP